MHEIIIVKRSNDWMAWLDVTTQWECGKTKEEALFKLIQTFGFKLDIELKIPHEKPISLKGKIRNRELG